MKTIVVIGGSKGIGKAILNKLLSHSKVVNISRTAPEVEHANLKHLSCDVNKDDLPDLDNLDTLIYCPGSINLKPISRLSIDDFKNDFEINVLGAVKAIHKYLPTLKNGSFFSGTSTVAPVFGLRPTRAVFWRTEKVPKEEILTCSPVTSASETCWSTLSTSCALSLRDRPTSRKTASLRSIRVSVFSLITIPPFGQA